MKIELIKPIRILLYEDNQDYIDRFKLEAQKHRILVEAVTNVDSFFEVLGSNPHKFKFLILDAIAFLHEGQTSGSESEANLIKIFRDLAILEKKLGRVFPCAINTGFANIKLSYQEVVPCPIFEKGNESVLLEHIKAQFINSEIGVLYAQYPEIMAFCESNLNDTNFSLFINLLKNENFACERIDERVKNLSSLRRLNESIFDLIFVNYLFNASGIIKSTSSRVNDIAHYLRDKNDIPPPIFGATVNIQKTASTYGCHNPDEASKLGYYPTSYTLKTLTNGLIDIIIWAKTKIL